MTDRLHEIGMKGTDAATRDDVRWLFHECSKLREMLEMTERALQNATVELGLIDDDEETFA